MDENETPAADWVLQLIRDYQDKITRGLFEAIYHLEGPPLDSLMRGQAHACLAAFLKLTALPTSMELGALLDAMRTVGPSQVEIQRHGDVILWTELHRGQCVCPFVRREVIRLDPKLCICGAYWVKYLFQTVANTQVEVETLETVATGSQNCRFRITITGPA